jgi:hypothetical protein
MFKHFDRHDVCESVISFLSDTGRVKWYSLALLLEIIDVDITSDDGDILESLFSGCSVDMEFLSFRIGQHGDLSKRVVLPISTFPMVHLN